MTIAEQVETLEPAWEIAHIFPPQGAWSEEEYISLTNRTNKLVEFIHGRVEVLPMPSLRHQTILSLLNDLFRSFIIARKLGKLLFSPLRVRVATGKFREPDLVFLSKEHAAWQNEQYFDGADLVVEVVSPDDPERDLVTKRAEYAESGIAEYWIVNPLDETITVLRLDGATYVEYGIFQRGDSATSVLLAGFAAPVSEVFDAQ